MYRDVIVIITATTIEKREPVQKRERRRTKRECRQAQLMWVSRKGEKRIDK
jgi:hypothetical protein